MQLRNTDLPNFRECKNKKEVLSGGHLTAALKSYISILEPGNPLIHEIHIGQKHYRSKL